MWVYLRGLRLEGEAALKLTHPLQAYSPSYKPTYKW